MITAEQMRVLADVVGGKGTLEYTPNHHLIVKVPTDQPEAIVAKLEQHHLMVMPVGEVLKVKACDFCYGEKADSIPYQRNCGYVGWFKTSEAIACWFQWLWNGMLSSGV